MMKRLVAVIILLTLPVTLFAEVVLSGLLRNDAFFVYTDNEPVFIDNLEARLNLVAKKDKKWMFYSDVRAYMSYGYYEGTSGLALQYQAAVPYQGYTTFKIMRAFLRLYTTGGDVTLGKTYINIGNASLFNPFDIDRTVNFTDISADKEGILGLEYNLFAGDFFELKIFGGMYNPDVNATSPHIPVGTELTFNVGSFELGAAFIRMRANNNAFGIFFKGDVMVGLQGSYAAHFNDAGDQWFHDANLGIDYSFLDGKLILNLMGYFNSSGALASSSYPSTLSSAGFPHAMLYVHGDITGVIDEFFRVSFMSFVNCIDGSSYLSPSLTWTIVDGLTLTFQLPFVLGNGGEFPSVSGFTINRGEFAALVRIEGKF